MRCSATAKRTGRQCEQYAINGGTVCHKHGGAAPQVKAKAEERIKALVNPALALIEEYLEHAGDPEYSVPPAVRLRAAESILDRAGYGATQKIRMDGDVTVRGEVDRELAELVRELEAQDRARGAGAPRADRLPGEVDTGPAS